MAVDDRISGKRGFIYYDSYDSGNPAPPQTFIAITNWQPRVRKHHQDTTNSTNYHPGQGILYAMRAPAAVDIEVAIEGRFRLNTTPYTWIRDIFNGENEPSRVELNFDEGQTFCSGYFTIHDFSCDGPIEGVVSYRAVIRNFGAVDVGPFTPIVDNGEFF